MKTLVSQKAEKAEPDGERLPGDANNDEEVNEKDILILVRYLGGEEVDINLRNADVNGDQLVDGRDAIHLMKYLAGEDDIELI